MLALGHETACFVYLGLGALVLSLRIFFVKNLLSSGWAGVDVALVLILVRLLLRGCCPLVPRNLLPVLCGGGAGPGLTWSCSPGHITASDLETGPWALLPRPSPAIRRLPMGWPGWGFVYVSTFCNVVCIISWKYWIPFLQNLSFLLRLRLIIFSSSAPSIFMPGLTEERVGVLVYVFIHQPPWLLTLNGSQVCHTRSPSLLRLNLLLIPKVSILSEQMEFCFSQNTFFLILTKE